MDEGQFAVTLESRVEEGQVHWVELLANGLTFDLSGLAPGPAEPFVMGVHQFGLDPGFTAAGCEALLLVPGPHLVSGGPMIPVLRCLAWLAGELCALDGLQAIQWSAARSLCGPAYFSEAVTRWIGGGAFPGLGLTALVWREDGAMQSEGLAMFTGQELVIDPAIACDRAQAAKLAVRMLHWLVENGKVEQSQSLTGPSGETLLLEPAREQGIVNLWKGSR